jgi:hypothetical protein
LGATTEPLDGRALTHGVDARAGEGAGGSAAFLHRTTMGALSLSPQILKVLVEVLRGKQGLKEEKGGCCCGCGPGGAAHRRRRGRRPRGRCRPAAAGPVLSCGWGRKMKGVRVSGFAAGLIYITEIGGMVLSP